VFASTFEEATYSDSDLSSRDFTFLPAEQLPTVTGVAPAFAFSASDKYRLDITGTGISDASVDTVDVYIGGIKQTTLTVSPTLVEVQIDDILSGQTAQPLQVYFEVGIPNGMPDFKAGVVFPPKLVSLSTATGSSAGAVIHANVQGAGTRDKLTLVDEAGDDMCASATVIRYGVLECHVKSADYSLGTSVRVKETATADGTVYEGCANDTPSACQYTTYATDIEFQAVAKTSPTVLSFTAGTDLDKFGTGVEKCTATFAGIAADSCEVISATEATATFTTGVPTSDTEQMPELRLRDTSGDDLIEQIVASDAVATGITNALLVTSEASGLVCSHAGGCVHTVTAEGLTSDIKGGKATIRVCGKECTLREDLSTASEAHCELPSIQTIGSRAWFSLAEDAPIVGPTITESGDWGGIAFDGENLPGPTGSGANCYIGTEFTDGFVGYITELRFFMDYYTSREARVGHLKFQGSYLPFDDSNLAIEDIVVVDEEIHEGWNYYDLSDNPRAYTYYRMFNDQAAGCNHIGEIKLMGQEVIDSTADTHDCAVKITRGAETAAVELANPVTYSVQSTPYVTAISPRWGTVEGGTTVTFTGDGFPASSLDYSITIDGVACADIAVSSQFEVTCVTGPRVNAWNAPPSLEMEVAGLGKVATQGNVFRYVSLWSAASTWGGAGAPMSGESVSVPAGLNLLVDVDHTPVLNLVIVDGGSIIFPPDADPEHERTFDAHYVFVHHGYFEAGTAEEPYTSKLTITMHGKKYDPNMPIYGNKCIGVRYGTIDIHGVERTPTWTELEATAAANQNQITLKEAVDWKVDEEIVIASTEFEADQAEKKKIVAIDRTDPDKPVLTLDSNLAFQHYASKDPYGDDFVEIRAEVGLLTRNVKYRGDPRTSARNQYGAHILVHSPGDETTVGRIGYVEFFDVGQAFQLGRYPIHFHMMGAVHKSYVIGNTVHQAYNRGTTVHGVHYLRILKNVYYDTMGHTVFLEDAVETKNRIEENLVVAVKPSFSLLNTDATPACFWITHPDNILVGNHAAGGPRYGFWYDLQDHPTGPSATSEICPINA
jgi:hypothetical protein